MLCFTNISCLLSSRAFLTLLQFAPVPLPGATEELLKAGHNVIIVDSFINSCSEAINRIKKISCKNIKLYVLDIKEKGLLRRVYGENHIDCVIHLAGLKAVGESINNPLIYYRNNIDTTLSLLECMRGF